MTLLSTLKTRPALALRAPQRRATARASRGPVCVRAQVLYHLHKKGESNVNAVIDLTGAMFFFFFFLPLSFSSFPSLKPAFLSLDA